MAALVAVFLAWRLRNPESTIVAAINNAGGKAVLGYKVDYCEERPWNAKIAYRSQAEPKRTLVEFFFGDCDKRRVQAIELPVNSITPELAEKLKALSRLNCLIIKMPTKPSERSVSRDFQQRLKVIKAANKEFESIIDQLNAVWGDKLMFDCGHTSYASSSTLQ